MGTQNSLLRDATHRCASVSIPPSPNPSILCVCQRLVKQSRVELGEERKRSEAEKEGLEKEREKEWVREWERGHLRRRGRESV